MDELSLAPPLTAAHHRVRRDFPGSPGGANRSDLRVIPLRGHVNRALCGARSARCQRHSTRRLPINGKQGSEPKQVLEVLKLAEELDCMT